MEIYKELNSTETKEFANLLNNQTKNKIEEGKIFEATVTKISPKYCWVYLEGLKSEPAIDINEIKEINLYDKIKEGSKLKIVVENLESKSGEIIVSASKAKKIEGYEKLLNKYEKNEVIKVKIKSKIKGGFICEEVKTNHLLFMPASQLSSRPVKETQNIINSEMEVKIIQADRKRANLCCSRRELVTENKRGDKLKIFEKYKTGDKVDDAIIKSITDWGLFFEINGEIDALCHSSCCSYQRIENLNDIFEVGQRIPVEVISKDEKKLQIGVSIKALLKNPFDNIDKYKVGEIYEVIVKKILAYGIFVELEDSLIALCHQSEISHTEKNPYPKNYFKLGERIKIKLLSIDKEAQRIAVSYRQTQDNPYESLLKTHGKDSIVDGVVSDKNENGVIIKLEGTNLEGYLHQNQLTWQGNFKDHLDKIKKGDKLKLKIVDVSVENRKILLSKKALEKDPMEFWSNKKIDDIVTTKVMAVDKKGLTVKPEGSELEIFIKKNLIAVQVEDSRPERFTISDRVDAAIIDINMDKRKISLSIKRVEEINNEIALKNYSDLSSGKSLPFANLSEKLDKKDKK
ncbi:MAG: 30S ribosomal protein S1 [Candidatus Pelagibacter sp.]|nr:30S ribosomal protein S1 [Candidatus Pelagibacter sp.]